jgi:hypothetical protein
MFDMLFSLSSRLGTVNQVEFWQSHDKLKKHIEHSFLEF